MKKIDVRTPFNRSAIFSGIQELRQAVDHATTGYIRSMPLCSYRVKDVSVAFDIRDLIIMGALTESDILLTGKTGSGKTRLANGAVKGLFGPDGCYSKTTLPSMNPAEFMDMDFPAILEGRKTLREAVSGIEALEKPAIVLNEVNRAPAVIQSLLIAFLDRELEIQGVPVTMGRRHPHGQYQFRVLTINEGGAYQVQAIDPAIRDRMTIEIPMDAFPQTQHDVHRMLNGAEEKPTPVKGAVCRGDGPNRRFDQVVRLRHSIEKMPIHPRSALFLNYLSGLSYCIRAPRGNKESVALSPEVCDGCHHMAAFYNLCGNVMAPSARILIKLQRLARAFAVFRSWRSGQDEKLVVLPRDIIEAAPFVFFSKLSLNPLWVRTAGDRSRPFLGDRWTAIREILFWIYRERFLPLVAPGSDVGEAFFKISRGMPLILADWKRVQTYQLEKDPWICDPALVRRSLSIDPTTRC